MGMFEFRLPDLGEGVAEGEVVAWHVALGDEVREDQDMVEVMTDKATVSIGAPRAGKISRINAAVGERVRVGSVLVAIATADDQASSAANTQAPPVDRQEQHQTEVVASAVGDLRATVPGAQFFARHMAAARNDVQAHLAGTGTGTGMGMGTGTDTSVGTGGLKPLATPATRKLARDLCVNLAGVPPTGSHGRVTNDDVRKMASSAAASTTPAGVSASETSRETRTPFVGMRRRTAERLLLSKTKAVHFTFVEEVEVDRLEQTLARLKPTAERANAPLHYLPFIVKAVTLALKKHPQLNSVLDEATNELVSKRYYHIGIATATDQGLLVPVVRDADQKSILDIARDITRLAEGARQRTLSAAELSGSTFTITSLGKQGGLLATPILNYPEVGILGAHRVKERPVVRNGQIVIGHVMNISLSFDHRVIDGHVGAAFAYDVIQYLESPELLFLELA